MIRKIPSAIIPAGTFRSVNCMTPTVLGYYKIKGGYAELSAGAGILGGSKLRLWGVTVSQRTAGKGQCFYSAVEAVDYLEELSA